jgi:hypothetical protein
MRGQFSPCGTFIYANTNELRIGSHTQQQELEGEHFITGSLIWRTHSGKLEKKEMSAMEETMMEHQGQTVKPTGVVCSKWVTMIDRSKKGIVRKYKILVTAGTDKLIRMYI